MCRRRLQRVGMPIRRAADGGRATAQACHMRAGSVYAGRQRRIQPGRAATTIHVNGPAVKSQLGGGPPSCVRACGDRPRPAPAWPLAAPRPDGRIRPMSQFRHSWYASAPPDSAIHGGLSISNLTITAWPAGKTTTKRSRVDHRNCGGAMRLFRRGAPVRRCVGAPVRRCAHAIRSQSASSGQACDAR
jgi:hypothetical protein